MRNSKSEFQGPRLAALLLPALLSTLVSAPALAESAMDWVQKMSNAMRDLNYRGNFVYMHENQLESMQISHYRDESGEKERLLSLNGEAREVIRDNQNLTCIWPSSRKVVVDASRKNSFSPIFIPEDIAHLEQFYRMSLIGRDRIAGMDSVIVHIDPLDRYRYGMKFWINADNGLMMKSSLIDESGREVEQVMFTSLEVFEDPEPLKFDTMPPIGDTFTLLRYHSGENVNAEAADSGWRLTNPPGGFRRESTLRRQIPGSENFVQQMVFSDGLASLSVFIERHANGNHKGGSSMGAVNAYIRIFRDHSVTAIGEVPAVTVKLVAESIAYERE